MIRVTHLCSGDLWAGAEVQIFLTLCEIKRRQKMQVNAIVLNDGTLVNNLRAAGIDVFVVNERQHGFFHVVRQICDILQQYPCDILHSHRYKENLIAAFVKRKFRNINCIHTVHGLPEPWTGMDKVKSLLRKLSDRIVRRFFVSAVIAVSHDIKNVLQKSVVGPKLVVIHNSIDPTRCVSSSSPEDIRNFLGLPPDSLVVGTISRLVSVKALHLILEACCKILPQLPQLQILIIGDGPERESLEKLANDLKLANHVKFTGFRSDAINITAALDVFVISSTHEGIPTALLEAMYLEVPPVATAVGGVTEVIEDGLSGLLVKSGDIDTLAQCILQLLRDPSARKSIGKRARKRIEEEFCIEGNTEKLIALYILLK